MGQCNFSGGFYIRRASGGRLPGGGGVPPGGKTISFSAEKETVLHPKEKEGARSMQGLWTKTAASGFRMTAGTPPGRYGLPL